MSNFPATLAAVAARGARCDHCGHWTFRPAKPPLAGRAADKPLCGNCRDLTFTTAVVSITGRGSVPARPLRPGETTDSRGFTGRRSAALLLRQRDGGRS